MANASYLRPRRGRRSTAISKDIMLKRGEVFFEVPDDGIGSGSGNIVMGDGVTAYKDLPYFVNGKSSKGEGSVSSVNYILPDEQGNVNLTTVPLAENLLSPDNQSTVGAFIHRASGGTLDVMSGEARLISIGGCCQIDPVTSGIHIAKPYKFIATGLNQFDKTNENCVLFDYYIDYTGKVTARQGYYIVFIRAAEKLDDGYTIYSNDGFIERVGWHKTPPTITSTDIIVTVDGEYVTSLTNDSKISKITNTQNGYLCVVCRSDYKDLCIHPTWSGLKDEIYEEYIESEIVLPTIDKDGLPLPNAIYGIPSIGAVADEMDLDNKVYRKRIGYYPFTAANLAKVQAMGVEYINDSLVIFYILPDTQVIKLPDDVSTVYTVNDYGCEEFTGTEVPLTATNMYGQNLRDKLRRNVVTISEQKLGSNSKAQVRENIGACSNNPEFEEASDMKTNEELINDIKSGSPMSTIIGSIKRLLRRFANQVAGKVASVNSIKPDEQGNVEIVSVQYAQNLVTSDNKEVDGTYEMRTTAGSSDIQSGDAYLSYIRGYAKLAGAITEKISISSSSSYVPQPGEEYEYIYAEINNEIWRNSSFGSADGTYIFKFDASQGVWKRNSTTVVLAALGITVSGDIKDNDTITVEYIKAKLGNITISNPTRFISTNNNIFNPSLFITGTIKNGAIASGSNKIYIVTVPKADTGFVVYSNSSVSVINMAYTKDYPAIGKSADTSYYYNHNGAYYYFGKGSSITKLAIDNIGYLCIEIGASVNVNNLVVRSIWSKSNPTDYPTRSNSIINIPTKDKNNTSLPTASYGMPSVGTIADELNFDTHTYIKRIERLTYSESNLNYVKSLLTPFIYDSNIILYVLEKPVEYDLTQVSNKYTAGDFGVEYFENASNGILQMMSSGNMYGQNLVDKLRRDVVTISDQTYSASEQTNLRNRIGAASSSEVSSQITVINNNMKENMYNININGWTTASGVPSRLRYKYEFAGSFSQTYNIFWRMHGQGQLATDTEAENIEYIKEVIFESNKAILYATEKPNCALRLGVVGGK